MSAVSLGSHKPALYHSLLVDRYAHHRTRHGGVAVNIAPATLVHNLQAAQEIGRSSLAPKNSHISLSVGIILGSGREVHRG